MLSSCTRINVTWNNNSNIRVSNAIIPRLSQCATPTTLPDTHNAVKLAYTNDGTNTKLNVDHKINLSCAE